MFANTGYRLATPSVAAAPESRALVIDKIPQLQPPNARPPRFPVLENDPPVGNSVSATITDDPPVRRKATRLRRYGLPMSRRKRRHGRGLLSRKGVRSVIRPTVGYSSEYFGFAHISQELGGAPHTKGRFLEWESVRAPAAPIPVRPARRFPT